MAGAYVRSVSPGNLRCFLEPGTIDFVNANGGVSQWTIVLGENGTGKTTLLQAIWSVLPNADDLNPPRSEEGLIRPRDFIVRPPKHLNDLGLIDSWVHANVGFSSGLADPVVRSVNIELHLRAVGMQLPEFSTEESYELGVVDLRAVCVAYGSLRRPSVARLSGDLPRAGESLFGTDVELINAEEFFLQRDYIAESTRADTRQRDMARRHRDLLEQLACAALPDVRGLRPAMVGTYGSEVLRLHAVTSFGDIPVDELGFGFRSTFAWIVDLAARMMAAYPNSDNPLAEPAVVLIDEIDLHLHPKWQRTLLAELSARFPNTQFIATAHSPLIVQGAPDANVVVLRREGDHVVIERAPDEVKRWRVDQILTSDLFGLATARPPQVEALIKERDALLAKDELTAKEQKRLDALREELAAMPEGESRLEMEAMELIRQAASSIKKDRKAAGTKAPRAKKGKAR